MTSAKNRFIAQFRRCRRRRLTRTARACYQLEPRRAWMLAAQSLRCPPSLLRQSSAFRTGKAATRPVFLFGLRPLHLCGTRLEGGRRRLPRTLKFAWVEPMRAVASTCRFSRNPFAMLAAVARHSGADARKVFGNRVPATAYQPSLPHRPGVRQRPGPTTAPRQRPSFHTTVSSRERPWCPPSRRVPHKWSGRRPNRYMGRVSGPPSRTRRTV